MKTMKPFLFIFSLAIFSQIAFGQNVIIYDNHKGEFKKPISPVTEGEFVTFKIVNINTFRYKVEIEGTMIDYVTQIPSELQTLFRLPSESVSASKTTDALNEAKDAAEPMKVIAKEVSDEVRVASTPAKEKLEQALKELTQACDAYILIAQKVANIKFLRVELINLSKHNWENYGKLAEKLPSLRARTALKKDYDDFVTAYAKAYALYTKAINAARVAQDTVKQKEIEKAEEKLEEANKKLNEEDFLKLIEDVMVLQEALQNSKYFEVKSAPIQMDGDFMEFTVKITPVQTNDLMPFEAAQAFPVSIPARGGLKVDFSVGPIISFGKNSRDEKYYFKLPETTSAVKDTTLSLLNNNNTISPSIAAMMHFYGRSGKTSSIGGLFGVGAGFQSINDVNLSIVAGLSMILGKREKIMLNTGVSYLRIERLKTNQYIDGGKYSPSKVSISDVTEKVFKPSFFLSISYNLTRRVQRN